MDGDRLVATGTTGEESLDLPSGDYTVCFRRDGKEAVREVTVEPKELSELTL